MQNKKNKSFLFLFIRYSLFCNHSVYYTFSYFSTACKHTHWVCSRLMFCNRNNAFHYWTDSLKQTPKSKWTFYVIYLPCQFSWWSLNFLKIRLASAEIKCLNCQKSDIRAYSACCSVLLWTSFCFLQVNQQSCVGMVSTNNTTYSKQIYKPF